MTWLEINSNSELENLFIPASGSQNEYRIIFKHSTRCGTSMIAKKEFEKHWKSDLPVHLINVVENRDISNQAEKLSGIKHESPQLLVIKDGKCVYSESHYGIDASEAMEFILLN